MTEDKSRKDNFLNNEKKNYFQHLDLKLNSRFSFWVHLPNPEIFQNKIICFKTKIFLASWNNKQNENEKKKSILEQSLQLLRPKER